MRPAKLRRLLALTATGAVLAGTGTGWVARADTVLAAEGLMQRPGKTQTAFGGVFCEHHTCRSVNNPTGLFTGFTNVDRGADRIGVAVGATEGRVTLLGWSLGAAAIEEQLRRWEVEPETAPEPERVRVVTFGAPDDDNDRNDRAEVAPAAPRYDRLDVVAQYDKLADVPTRWGWYSQRELSLSRHMSYDEADINNPANLVYRDGNTTHMLIPATELRQLRGLRWLRDIGWVSAERYDEVDAERRARIEADFDRPDFQPQGPGADWANGIEPAVLRDEEETWTATTESPTEDDGSSPNDTDDGSPSGLTESEPSAQIKTARIDSETSERRTRTRSTQQESESGGNGTRSTEPTESSDSSTGSGSEGDE